MNNSTRSTLLGVLNQIIRDVSLTLKNRTGKRLFLDEIHKERRNIELREEEYFEEVDSDSFRVYAKLRIKDYIQSNPDLYKIGIPIIELLLRESFGKKECETVELLMCKQWQE